VSARIRQRVLTLSSVALRPALLLLGLLLAGLMLQ